MDLIDNRGRLLGDDLKKEVKRGAIVRMVASYFSIYAFEALKEELSSVLELQFIFPNPTFVQEGIKDKIRKETREYFIPKPLRESSLYGTEFEIRLRNQLTQKVIAKECAEWIREKVKFKSNITDGELQNFIYIENADHKVIYTPIRGFTSVDLGYEKNNMIYQGIMKNDEESYAEYFFNQFKYIWDDDAKVQDVTQSIVDYISSAYIDNSPEYIYFVTIYNIFSEFLDDIMSEDFMPNEGTGFKNSLVWQKLYSFQRDGAIGVIQKLEKYNGCILADSVGLGKTFTALAVMKYYSSRNKNILVLAPKKLANNWNQYRDNVRTNLFYKDRIHFDVLYHTDLGRTHGFSNGHDLSKFNWDNYDLVVIDESHNFRNANSYRDKETRYDFLINKVLKSGVRTKVLMLSATPVNNRFTDLKNQLALAYGDNYAEFNERLDTSKSFDVVLANAQRAFNEWTKLPKEQRKAADLMSRLDIDFSILLDNVTIARSRKHIVRYYDSSEIGSFPTRRKPVSYYCDIARKEDTLSYNDIFNTLMGLTMGVYAPMNYILPSRISKYEALYDTKVGRSTLKQVNREQALQRLMTINMLKRLESCVDSFRKTVRNICDVNKRTYDSIIQFENDRASSRTLEFSQIDEETLDDEDFDINNEGTLGKVRIDFSDMDLVLWKRDLKYDIETLEALYELMCYVTPDRDLKLQKLVEIVKDKIEHPFNLGNKKVLIFSAFADTTNYLYENLAPMLLEKYGLYSARIQGAQKGNATNIRCDRDTDRLLTLFSPISKERDVAFPADKDLNIDVLIATDCVSEGQNLQDCDYLVNYDIHWNPVRIIQRFGRIDRIGSKNEYIQLVNFWPDMDLDEYINLKSRVETRMKISVMTSTGDDDLINAEEKGDLEYRRAQLKRLQEEVVDVEDMTSGISIMDLGLNEFRLDLLEYMKHHEDIETAPKGLNAVVGHTEESPAGVIFVLRNINNSVNIDNRNRIHPFYMVYISEEGEIICDYLNPKKLLDTMRLLCRGKSEPVTELYRKFNEETDDGRNMGEISELLSEAINSIIDVKEESDIDSLFKSGGTTALLSAVSGLDDFELICFLVVK